MTGSVIKTTDRALPNACAPSAQRAFLAELVERCQLYRKRVGGRYRRGRSCWHPAVVRVLREIREVEMVATFLLGELSSERFGPAIRDRLVAMVESDELLAHPDLSDRRANESRARVLAATRGYGEDRELFEFFPSGVRWVKALLAPAELARVRYIEYSYWNEISGGSRLPTDAAKRIRAGVEAFGVPNQRFLATAAAVAGGERFPPLILAGVRVDDLVCLEGNLRLTGYALADFPVDVECIVGIHPRLDRWAQ